MKKSFNRPVYDLVDELIYQLGSNPDYAEFFGLKDVIYYDRQTYDEYKSKALELQIEGYHYLSNFDDPQIFSSSAEFLANVRQNKELVFTAAYNNEGEKVKDMISVFARDNEL